MSEKDVEILSLLRDRDKAAEIAYNVLFSHYDRLLKSHGYLKINFIRLSSAPPNVKDSELMSKHISDRLESEISRLKDENYKHMQNEVEWTKKILDANEKANEKQKLYEQNLHQVNELTEEINRLVSLNGRLKAKIRELEDNNKNLRDEHSASTLTIKSYEKQLKEAKEEMNTINEVNLHLQKRLEDFITAEHIAEQERAQEARRRELQEAASQLADVEEANYVFIEPSRVPTRQIGSISDANDDLTHVLFGPSGQLFGCAGTDRKIKLWNFDGSRYEFKGTYLGSNKTVNSIDFSPDETLVLGSSNDATCRIWSINDQRLRTTFTGHSDNVVSAKFISTSNKVATISTDRLIKIWSLERKNCICTKTTISVGHDIVYNPEMFQLISGHFDKKIRIWDVKGDSKQMNVDQVTMPDRITGLDISKDCNYLLVSTRDNALRTLDLRMANKVLNCYQHDDFRIAYDYVRPCFSPDGLFLACGSQDQKVYVWKRFNPDPVCILQGHNTAVISCSWRPGSGDALVSCERNKQVILWGP